MGTLRIGQHSPLRALSTRRLAGAFVWIAGSVLGWLPVPVLLNHLTLRTYLDALRALPGFLALGVLAGLIAGAGQGLVWHWQGQPARRWVWATAAGYGLAFPAGLCLDTLIPTIAWGLREGDWLFMPLTEPGSISFWPFPTALMLAGFVVGLCQWPALKRILGHPTPAMGLLWVLGVWLGIGLGLFAGAAAGTIARGLVSLPGLSDAIFGVTWGATAGWVSGVVLGILVRAQGRPEEPAR